jgi:NADH-quinone oxidoreductase subunit H
MSFWTDPIRASYEWLMLLLTGWGLPGLWANVLVNLIGIVVLVVVALVLDIMLVWVERKVVARFQGRLGPNRVGPFGLFQPFPDIIKLIIKEDITPTGADKVVYNMAPVLSAASVIFLWAVVPLASRIYGTDLNVAVLYLIASGALGTLAIIMAGWSSNNKYALLGAFRQVATMISYEIPMAVALLIPVVITGSLSLKVITETQGNGIWFVLLSPLGALLFMISAIAELGRSPFDLNEGESEIVSGFHIEYSGMKFGWFYAGELLHAFTFGGFAAVLFFGGWQFPFLVEEGFRFGSVLVALPGIVVILLQVLTFVAKAMFGYWVIMWVKYTMPRIRIDHMLAFNWKFLTPLSFVLLMVTAIVDRLLAGGPMWVYVSGMFLSNVLVGWVTVEILRAFARGQRKSKEVIQPVAQAAHH